MPIISKVYYRADGVTVRKERYDDAFPADGRNKPETKRVERKPTAEQWVKFWRTVDRLRLERWKAFYSTEDLRSTKGEKIRLSVDDGTAWTVTYSSPQRTFEAKGANVYPVQGYPERATLDSRIADIFWAPNMVDQLCHAFDELLGEPPHR